GMLSVRGLHPVAAGDRTRQCRQKRAPKCPGSVKGKQRHLPFRPTASSLRPLRLCAGPPSRGLRSSDAPKLTLHPLRGTACATCVPSSAQDGAPANSALGRPKSSPTTVSGLHSALPRRNLRRHSPDDAVGLLNFPYDVRSG